MPVVSLRLKKIQRRFGIMAPRVVVRSHVSWQLYVFPVVLLLLLVVVMVWSLTRQNEAGVLVREMSLLREQLSKQREELYFLRSTAGTGKNAVAIERATQAQLLAKLEALESENAALKEDMLTFERLIPSAEGVASISVESFRVVPELPGGFQYRLLLVYLSDKRVPTFQGRLRFLLTCVGPRGEQLIALPGSADVSSSYRLEVRHFLRKEGVFQLPEGFHLKGVEVQVFQGDVLKSKRVVKFRG